MHNSATRSAAQAWAVFDDFPDAIAVLGRDLRWLYAHPAVEKVLGTASGGMIGKKAERNRASPAIALTGYAKEDDRAATRAAGYQAVVTKPVNLDDLVNTILDVARRP